MKKTIVALLFMLCVHGSAWAFDTNLLLARNKIFEEAKQLQSLVAVSKDPVAVISLWDTAILTATQLNAYFYMVGVFEAAESQNTVSVGYLKSWLDEVKRTAQLNIQNLPTAASMTQPESKEHLSRVKAYLSELVLLLDREVGRVTQLQKTVKPASARITAGVPQQKKAL